MRIGQNPAKSISHVPQPQRVTVAILTYVPFLSGYYAQSLEVLKACLGSLQQNTEQPFDLLVFDNASCPEVHQYLTEQHDSGMIQYLVLSARNVGKGGAWNLIFQGAPGQVVAYADSDVYFYPGWLRRSLEILDTFPRVGMVTARPLRAFETYYSSTLEWARQDTEAALESGQFIPWEVYIEHADSLGQSPEESRKWFDTLKDWRIHYRGLTAHAGAAHFQFTAFKDVLKPLFPLHMNRPMGQVRGLDQALNEQGYLRLATCEPLVKHLGNRLERAENYQRTAARRSPARIWNLPLIRKSLLWIYNQIFRIYFEGKP